MRNLVPKNSFTGWIFLSAVIFSFSTVSAALAEGVGRKPAFLPETFVEEEEGMPKFLRIDVRGYNIRKTPEFSFRDLSNLDFRSQKGATYPIKDIVKLKTGNAVQVMVDDQERWVFVPYWRKQDFQFCYSEACFSDLTQVLTMLEKMNVTTDDLRACGYSLDADGSLVDHNLPLTVDQSEPRVTRTLKALSELTSKLPIKKISRKDDSNEGNERGRPSNNFRTKPNPPPRLSPAPSAAAPRYVAEVPPEVDTTSEKLRYTPLWELSKGGTGKKYTKLLSDSIDRYGQNLLSISSLSDQDRWCPNFSSLSMNEKKEFWMHLFNAIAKRESAFKEQTTFDEDTYRNVYRGRIRPNRYSMGLFQMSYSSGGQKAYRNFCHFDWSRDRNKDVSDPSLSIYDPENQMNCAVGVMNYWVRKDRGLGWSRSRGGARFWSTLRSSNPSTRLVIASLKRYAPCWR